MWSDLTFDLSFKVKRGYPNLKVLLTCLLFVLEVCSLKLTYRKSFGWESSDVVRFDLEPLSQGRASTAKLKSSDNSLFTDPRGLQCETIFLDIMGWGSSDVVRFDLWPLLQGQTMVHWLW